MGLAFAVIAVLYAALAVATIAVTAGRGSRIPLADLIAVGFGGAGRDATAVLALALTMGTLNVYTGSAAKLAAALAAQGALPAWLAAGAPRSIPRRPLAPLVVTGAVLLVALAAGAGSTADLVRATSACFIVVYVLALAAAVRILPGRLRAAAAAALTLVCVVAVFSAAFLVVPLAAVAVSAAFRARARRAIPVPAPGDGGRAAAPRAERAGP